MRLGDDEREIAVAETEAVLEHASDPANRERLAALLAALAGGELSAADTETLGQVLELSLHAGRVRALYGPGGEQAALQLYRRLPAGAAVVRSAGEVTEALRALSGTPLESVSIRALGPGSFALALAAGGSELTVRLDRQGVRLTSAAI